MCWSRSLPAGTPVSRPRSVTPAPCSSDGVPSARTKSGASRLAAAAGRAVSDAAANGSKRQRPSSAELADAEAAWLDSGQQQPHGTCRQHTSETSDISIPICIRPRNDLTLQAPCVTHTEHRLAKKSASLSLERICSYHAW